MEWGLFFRTAVPRSPLAIIPDIDLLYKVQEEIGPII